MLDKILFRGVSSNPRVSEHTFRQFRDASRPILCRNMPCALRHGATGKFSSPLPSSDVDFAWMHIERCAPTNCRSPLFSQRIRIRCCNTTGVVPRRAVPF